MAARPASQSSESAPGSRSGRPQQARSRRTRERILEAGFDCFDRLGFDETTTATIASDAGIAVGTLYGHFADKREIFVEIVMRFSEELEGIVSDRLNPVLARTSDPRAQAEALIDAVFHIQTLRPGIQQVFWARYFMDDEIRALMDATRQRLVDTIVAFCAAIDPALLRAPVDVVAARTIAQAVEWNAVQARLAEDDEHLEAAVASSGEMIARFLFRD